MWQSRPVFISSTFADMQAERDYLRTRVFPELEERLRARRHSLEWVDLRVGVATASQRDEQARELYVLKVCLDEVKRCRPFLIVLLGDRYGWVPPEERVKAAAEEAREGFSSDVAGRSVTDLEIEFGVLSEPAQQSRSFFYLREPLPYADMPADVAALYSEDYAADGADRKERLAALKRRIGKQLPARIRRYSTRWDGEHHRVAGLEDFGCRVLDDIWSELEAETQTTATAADIPWQQVERDALEDFIDDRARDFVGRQGLLDSLIGLASAAESATAAWGTCITGDPGSGKSALFGALYRRLHGSDVFLLAHAAGASANAASVDFMLRRWIGELAGAIGTDPGLADNADPDTVEAAFARLLGQMSQRRRVVVLVDALDQFENTTRGRYITWLPRLWPANTRFIATAIPGDASKALAERQGLEALPLPPLDAVEARDMVAGICRRYHRAFEPEVIEALLAKRGPDGPAWGNPLWLVLAVEDLNLLDADDFARAHRDYAGAPAERLRALMLDTVAAFPVHIPGLYAYTFERAEDLFGASLVRGFLSLIAVSRGGWRESDFRILLPLQSGENWDELKFAQLRRLFRGQLHRRGALAQWDFSHTQMRAAVRARLAAWGMSGQNLHTIVADRLLSCATDDPLHVSETMVHLLASEDYDRAARYYGDSSLTEAEVQGATRVLGDAIIAPPFGTTASAAREICRLLRVSDDSVCASAAERLLFDVGDVIEQMAALDARLIVFDSTKQVFERLVRSDNGSADRRRNLSVAYDRVGAVLAAQGNLPGALLAFRDSVSIRERLARADPNDADRQGDLARSYGRVGGVLLEQGNLPEALQYFHSSAAIRVQWRQPGSDRDLWQCYMQLGDAMKAQNYLPDALQTFRDAQGIAERLAHADSSNAGLQYDLAVSYDRLGLVLLAQGNFPDALRSFHNEQAIDEGLTRADPSNAGWQRGLALSHEHVGDVLQAQGNLPEALQSFRAGRAISERLARTDPDNLVWQRILAGHCDRAGSVLLAQSNLPEALQCFRSAHAIAERLVRSDPSNAGWQRDLAISQAKMATVFDKLGETAHALDALRRGRAVEAKVEALWPALVNMKPDLAWFDSEIERLWMLAPRPPDPKYRSSMFYQTALRTVAPRWYRLREVSNVGMIVSVFILPFIAGLSIAAASTLVFAVLAIVSRRKLVQNSSSALRIAELLSQQWSDRQYNREQALREHEIEIQRLKSIYRDRFHAPPPGRLSSSGGTMYGARGEE